MSNAFDGNECLAIIIQFRDKNVLIKIWRVNQEGTREKIEKRTTRTRLNWIDGGLSCLTKKKQQRKYMPPIKQSNTCTDWEKTPNWTSGIPFKKERLWSWSTWHYAHSTSYWRISDTETKRLFSPKKTTAKVRRVYCDLVFKTTPTFRSFRRPEFAGFCRTTEAKKVTHGSVLRSRAVLLCALL